MTHLKQILFGLALAVALALVGTNSAYADCSSAAKPVILVGAQSVRAEGTTELIANVQVTCPVAAGTAYTQTPSNITLTFAPATTKVTVGAGTTVVAAGTTPTVNGAVVLAPTVGSWSNLCVAGGAADNRSFFPCPALSSTIPPAATPAVTTSGNILNFNFTPCGTGVAPCASAAGTANAGASTYYITGIRVNISSTGLPAGGVLTATVVTGGGVGTSSTGSIVFGIVQQTLGAGTGFGNTTTLAIPSCGPTIKTPVGQPATVVVNPDPFATAGTAGASIRVVAVEGFLGAFVTAATNDPGSGLGAGGNFSSTSPGVFPGAGTRIRVNFTGIPTGMVLYAPETVTPAGGSQGTVVTTGGAALTVVTLVTGAALDGSGGAPLGAPINPQWDLIVPSGGAASVIYEVTTAAGITGLETMGINIAITGTGTVGIGSVSGVISLAPIGPPTVNPNLPQFAALSKPVVVATVSLCATYLLFPWIANTGDGNYDTGFAIANTTSDPSVIGTTGQTGDVNMYIFPSDGSSAITQTIATGLKPGATATFVLSSLKKAVLGYAIVVCNFTLGHGFAFIINPNAVGGLFAEGYLALSIGNPRLGPFLAPFESVGM
jgi:hypothetical protein